MKQKIRISIYKIIKIKWILKLIIFYIVIKFLVSFLPYRLVYFLLKDKFNSSLQLQISFFQVKSTLYGFIYDIEPLVYRNYYIRNIYYLTYNYRSFTLTTRILSYNVSCILFSYYVLISFIIRLHLINLSRGVYYPNLKDYEL